MPAYPLTGRSQAQLCGLAMLVLAAAAAGAALIVSGMARAGGGGGGGDWKKPGFCSNMDCPRYSSWQKSPDFQIREYEEASWVATNVSSLHYELAVKEALPRLLEYFYGANEEGLRLKETVPLAVYYRTDVHPHAGFRNYSAAMYLPYNYQDEPPKPNSTDLWIYRSSRAALAVRMFQHRAREARVLDEAAALVDALEHAGHTDYEANVLMVASYDHPTKHYPRRRHYRYSEVWIEGDFKPEELASAQAPGAGSLEAPSLGAEAAAIGAAATV